MAELTHGGDVEGFREEFGTEPLDFSANGNPLGVPEGVAEAIRLSAARCDRYPDPLCRALTAAIAAHDGVDRAWVLCGNGSADLLYRLALALRPKEALVTAPTFSEYEQAFALAGTRVLRHELRREEGFAVTERFLEELRPGLGAAVLCNPNNPTGRTVSPALLRAAAEKCQRLGILLLADECFVGLLDDPKAHALTDLVPQNPGLMLLRAFTKLYGMAGVRLGYCVCSDAALLEKMRLCGQPWSVSVPAQEAGLAALKEEEYLRRSRALIREERAFLAEGLRALGLWVEAGEANYLFFQGPETLAGFLRRRGVLIRDCRGYPGLSPGDFRCAVRTRPENETLLRAIRETGEMDA